MISLISTLPRRKLALLWRPSCGFYLCSHYATFISLNLSCVFRFIKCYDQKDRNTLSSVPSFSFSFVVNVACFCSCNYFGFVFPSLYFFLNVNYIVPLNILMINFNFFISTSLFLCLSFPLKIYSSSEFPFWSILLIQYASASACIFLCLIASLY